MSERHNVILVLYDLPSVSTKDKKSVTEFRKQLIRSEYIPLQKSVYVKLIRNTNTINSEFSRLEAIVPAQGNVKALPLSLSEFRRLVSLTGVFSYEHFCRRYGNYLMLQNERKSRLKGYKLFNSYDLVDLNRHRKYNKINLK